MSQIKVHDRQFPLIENFTFGEIDYVEKLVAKPLDEWTSTTTVRATIFLSLRRGEPGFLSWKSMNDMTLDEFSFLDDDGQELSGQESEAPADPTNEAETDDGSGRVDS